MTALIEIQAQFQTKLKEALADMDGVLSGTPYSTEREAAQNDCAAELMIDIENAFNDFVRRVVSDINADLDALTRVEKVDLADGSFATIVGNWDYPFRRRAEELRNDAPDADRTADRRAAA